HIEGIFINKTESLLVALLVFFLCAAFVRKNKYLLQTGLVFSLLFLSYHSINKFEMAKTNRLVIHNIPQSVSFSIKEKNKIHLFADTAFINNRYKTDYYYKRYSSSLGVAFSNVVKHSFFEEEKFASSSVFHSQNVLVCNGMPLAVLTPHTDWKTLPTLRYKYIMITGNPRLNLDKILANIKTESIIFTTDNSLPHIARWKASCIKAGVKTVDFREIKSIIIES
ncbi:MAG: DUF986 family protein, partial [Bacteroidetes bacterium]|nr:DUF986 family protein [Bacteroidota bacterium]